MQQTMTAANASNAVTAVLHVARGFQCHSGCSHYCIVRRFVREALQDPELLAKYAKTTNITHPPTPRKEKWPPPDQLQK